MLRRWVDKHGNVSSDGPELRVRHDRTHRAVGPIRADYSKGDE